jgi:hypothetical protein
MENAASQSARFADLTGRLAVELRERLAADRPGFPFQQQTLDYVYREIELPLVPSSTRSNAPAFASIPRLSAGSRSRWSRRLNG